ncbi:hypothetical protein [Caulobacter sp. LARHSG274]
MLFKQRCAACWPTRLELVGYYLWSTQKAGEDIGELCDLPPFAPVAILNSNA